MQFVRVVDSPDSEPEVFFADHFAAVDLGDSQLVTLINWSLEIVLHFQHGIGAQCNVIPVELCKKASNDYELRRVTPLNTHLKACGGCKLTVTGQFCICVWRDDFKCQLDCKLVDPYSEERQMWA